MGVLAVFTCVNVNGGSLLGYNVQMNMSIIFTLIDVYKRQAGWYNVAWAFGAIVASFLVVKRFRNSGHNTAVSYTHLDVYKRQI